MIMTETLTFVFCGMLETLKKSVDRMNQRHTIWTFHNKMAGSMERLKSVTISIAEKNKLTLVFSWRLHFPFDAPHSVSIG
jgi:hypothetical protein